jgi:hypothetical protein
MTASRPIVGKPDSYALRAESTASRFTPTGCVCVTPRRRVADTSSLLPGEKRGIAFAVGKRITASTDGIASPPLPGGNAALPLRSENASRLPPRGSHRRFCHREAHITASAEGVGALLAGDLARSGSNPEHAVSQTNLARRTHDRFAANRRQAGLLRPPGGINSERARLFVCVGGSFARDSVWSVTGIHQACLKREQAQAYRVEWGML